MIGLAGSIERRILRRTRMVVAVNLASAIGLVVLLVSGIAYVVSAHQQNGANQRYVGFALGQDSGGVKYSCLWLFTMPAGGAPGTPVTVERVDGAAAAPRGFPVMASLRAVAGGGAPIDQTVPGNRTVYLVRTVRVGGQVRQAVFDLTYQRDNNRQLLTALMVAGLAGLAGAGALGLLLSRRTVRPLEEALSRQQRFVADASHELRGSAHPAAHPRPAASAEGGRSAHARGGRAAQDGTGHRRTRRGRRRPAAQRPPRRR